MLNRKDILQSQDFSKSYEPPQYNNFILSLSALGEGTWKNIFPKPPYQKWESEEGFYLKLHGSVDWVYCPNEYCRGFGKVFPVISASSTNHAMGVLPWQLIWWKNFAAQWLTVLP